MDLLLRRSSSGERQGNPQTCCAPFRITVSLAWIPLVGPKYGHFSGSLLAGLNCLTALRLLCSYLVPGLTLYADMRIPILFSGKTLSRFEVLGIETTLKLTLELTVGHSLREPLRLTCTHTTHLK